MSDLRVLPKVSFVMQVGFDNGSFMDFGKELKTQFQVNVKPRRISKSSPQFFISD